MARLLIGLSIGALLMTACDSGPEVPDGFTEAAAGPVTFAHPNDWTEGSPTGGADSATLLEYSFDSEGASVHSRGGERGHARGGHCGADTRHP